MGFDVSRPDVRERPFRDDVESLHEKVRSLPPIGELAWFLLAGDLPAELKQRGVDAIVP